MANVSALHTNAVNIRAAGTKDQATGFVYGGTFFPEHSKNGKVTNARWEGNCFINHMGYTDGQGVFHEPANDMIRVVAWNGRNSAPGKGLADIFAKIVSVGKEFSCALRLSTYQKRLMINNQPMADSQGQHILYPAINFIVEDKLIWGDDSANVIAQEIANWASYPYPTFCSRPTYWNVSGHADNEAWKFIIQKRMAEIYTEGQVYGYARVIIPEGAVLVNKALPPQLPVQQMQTPVYQQQPMMQQQMQQQMQQPMQQPMMQQPMQPMQQQPMQPPVMQQPMMQQPMMPMQQQMQQPMQQPMQPMQQPMMQQQMQQPMMPSMPVTGTPVLPTEAATRMMTSSTPI